MTAEQRRARMALKEQRTLELEDHMYSLALGATHQETQLRAASTLHGIYNGTPVSRSLVATTDPDGLLTPDDIRAELARLAAERAALEVDAGEGGADGAAPE